jgi:hypothetical protein
MTQELHVVSWLGRISSINGELPGDSTRSSRISICKGLISSQRFVNCATCSTERSSCMPIGKSRAIRRVRLAFLPPPCTKESSSKRNCLHITGVWAQTVPVSTRCRKLTVTADPAWPWDWDPPLVKRPNNHVQEYDNTPCPL